MKVILAVLIGLLGCGAAWAALGQRVDSVQSDTARLHGELRAVAHQGYSVQQITSADGTVVKEYVSPSGMIFGISWHATAMPNLEQLLGAYFPEFQKAAGSSVHRRRAVAVKTDQVVVESGGHLRSFHGRAYVPGLVPGNLSPAVVQ